MDDGDLFATIRRTLFTAVIGDVMDAAGLTHQFLPPEIRALQAGPLLVGRAMPVLEADYADEAQAKAGERKGFGLMFKALDSLVAGDIYICSGASPRYALWGGLMSTKAQSLGAIGAVVDGFHRDTAEIVQLNFPVYSQGAYAQDQRLRGSVVDFRCAIEFRNGARVAPGDIIVGDIDGVLTIPAAQAADIIAAALRKVEGEETVRQRILAGENTQVIFEDTGIM